MLQDQYFWFSVLLTVAVAASQASAGFLRGQPPSWEHCEAGMSLYPLRIDDLSSSNLCGASLLPLPYVALPLIMYINRAFSSKIHFLFNSTILKYRVYVSCGGRSSRRPGGWMGWKASWEALGLLE